MQDCSYLCSHMGVGHEPYRVHPLRPSGILPQAPTCPCSPPGGRRPRTDHPRVDSGGRHLRGQFLCLGTEKERVRRHLPDGGAICGWGFHLPVSPGGRMKRGLDGLRPRFALTFRDYRSIVKQRYGVPFHYAQAMLKHLLSTFSKCLHSAFRLDGYWLKDLSKILPKVG